MKLKRKPIAEKYDAAIDAMYEPRQPARGTEVGRHTRTPRT